jgi:hypothetical protein
VGGRVFGPTGAAAKLGIPRSTLESKIKALKIDKNRFKMDPESCGLELAARYSGQQVNFFRNTEYCGLLCGFLNRAREVCLRLLRENLGIFAKVEKNRGTVWGTSVSEQELRRPQAFSAVVSY